MSRPKPLTKEWFLKNVNKTDGCWLWTSTVSSTGYGRTSVKKKPLGAHRVSAHIFKGFDLNSKLFVCHHCDNPICVNPEHLFIGTARDNTIDMYKKGRRPKKYAITPSPWEPGYREWIETL